MRALSVRLNADIAFSLLRHPGGRIAGPDGRRSRLAYDGGLGTSTSTFTSEVGVKLV